MRVTGAKQQYDELIAVRSWDKETQIRFFLEYAEEYQLSAHFLSYLTLKPIAADMTPAYSGNYSTEQLLALLSKSETITRIIKENAIVTQVENPWTEHAMLTCIAEELAVSVDPGDKSQMQDLLTYFNEKHAYILRSMNKTLTVAKEEVTDKYRFGARG